MASLTHACAVVAAGLTMSSVDTPAAYFYCFAVPERSDRPRPIMIAGAIGLIEALALALYGLSIVAFERSGETSGISGSGADLAPGVLVGLFLAFAAIVLLVTRLLVQGRPVARTPFAMTQAFALVIAQPLVTATGTRVFGILIIALAIAALVALFAARELLR